MVKLSVGKGLDWMYFLILTLLMSCIVSCSTANSVAVSPLPTHTVTHATLRSLALKRHFYIGTTVNMDALQDEAQYSRTLATEFNMVTPEVVMKFDATEPQSDVFNFAEGDRLLSYAQAHGMQVRGHNLVWYTALPDWLTKGKFSRDQLIAILREHILTEVSHYRGQVNIWDVVNEALNDDGTLRNSIWLQGIAPIIWRWPFVGRIKPTHRRACSTTIMAARDWGRNLTLFMRWSKISCSRECLSMGLACRCMSALIVIRARRMYLRICGGWKR